MSFSRYFMQCTVAYCARSSTAQISAHAPLNLSSVFTSIGKTENERECPGIDCEASSIYLMLKLIGLDPLGCEGYRHPTRKT